MAKNRRSAAHFGIIEHDSYELALFEITGANPRDGERFIRMTIGGTDYAITAEVAQQLGAQLILAADQLPETKFERSGDGGET